MGHNIARTYMSDCYQLSISHRDTVSLQSEGCDSVLYTTMQIFILRCVHSRHVRKENSSNGFFFFCFFVGRKTNMYLRVLILLAVYIPMPSADGFRARVL